MNKKGVLSVVCAAILACCCFGFTSRSAFENEYSATETNSANDDYMICLSEAGNLGFNTTKVVLKNARDFNNNAFLIGEQCENGYFIYNITHKTMVEYSLKAVSPYEQYEDKLYYGGPTYYFVEQDGECISLLDETERYKKECIAKIDACNFETSVENANEIMPYAVTYGANVDHPEFFSEECEINCSYFQVSPNGNCGFIGLGMLIGYADKYKNDKLMDNKYYEDSTTKKGLKNYVDSIGYYLYNLNPKDSTTSMHIKNTMEMYAKERGVTILYNSKWYPTIQGRDLYRIIRRDTPVELFGSFVYIAESTSGKVKDHAIVAYGAQGLPNNDYRWRCHLGWGTAGLSDVMIGSCVIGSVYYFDI